MEFLKNMIEGITNLLGVIAFIAIVIMVCALTWDWFMAQIDTRRNAKIRELEHELEKVVGVLKKCKIEGITFDTYETNVIDKYLGKPAVVRGWSMRDIEMAKLFRLAAQNSNQPTKYIQMADWWEYRAKLTEEFQSLIKHKVLVEIIFFPYFICKWRQYYKKSKNWDRVFTGLELIKKDEQLDLFYNQEGK